MTKKDSEEILFQVNNDKIYEYERREINTVKKEIIERKNKIIDITLWYDSEILKFLQINQ